MLAIEKDKRLIPFLTKKFTKEIEEGRLQVVEGDALDFEPSDYQLKTNNYKLVANIPYYITGALLRKFLTNNEQPSTMVLLVQKEVAERIVGNPERSRGARSKKESLLSLSVKAYGEPRYIKTAPRGAFYPKPGVDSAILAIEDISKRHFKSGRREKHFFELLRAGFSSKRKLLRGNLQKLLGTGAAEALAHSDIPENARAEDVPIEKWLALVAHTVKIKDQKSK